MNTPKNLLILGLCLLFIGIVVALLFRPAPTPILIGTLTTDQENELRANLVTLESENDSLRQELGKVVVRDSVQKEAHRTAIQTFKKVIARLERDPEVIQVRDSLPKIDSLLKAKDSVIVHHEIRIADLEHSAQVTKGINERLHINFEKRLSDTQGLLVDKEAEVGELQNENRKLRRKLTFTKIGGVLVLLGIGALSL